MNLELGKITMGTSGADLRIQHIRGSAIDGAATTQTLYINI